MGRIQIFKVSTNIPSKLRMLRAGLTSRVVARCVTSRSRVSPLSSMDSLPCSVCFGLHRAILAEGKIFSIPGGADHQGLLPGRALCTPKIIFGMRIAGMYAVRATVSKEIEKEREAICSCTNIHSHKHAVTTLSHCRVRRRSHFACCEQENFCCNRS